MPDRGNTGQQALCDTDGDSGHAAAAVQFQVELACGWIFLLVVLTAGSLTLGSTLVPTRRARRTPAVEAAGE